MSIETKIRQIVADLIGSKIEEVELTSTPDSLAMDSLDAIELVMAIEQDFSIELSDADLREDMTIQDLVNLAKAEI